MSAGGESECRPRPSADTSTMVRVDVVCSRRFVSKELKLARMVLQSDRAATAANLRKVESVRRGRRECHFGE